MLLAGPSLDAARLSAVVRQALPGALVVSRAATLAALTTAPVPQAAQAALTQAMAAAAGFGALVLLLSLLLTARTREMTLAYLATMGLRRGQAQLLLAAETLPPVAAAAIGGVACAWLLVPSNRAVAEPGRLQRDRGGGHRDRRRAAAARGGSRAAAGRVARAGRPSLDHLPPRQHAGGEDR